MSEELLYNQLYERTKEFGRSQFIKELMRLERENKELHNKIEYLKNKIENKDRWCQLIADIGYDYDGYRKAENLMSLIDELVRYALNSRDNYDYEEILKDSDIDE